MRAKVRHPQVREDREATIKLAAAVLCARAAQFGDAVIADREPTPKQGDALMEAAIAYARAVRG